MPVSKHRRQGRKRPRNPDLAYTDGQIIGKALRVLIDDRCLELYGTADCSIEQRSAVFEQMTEEWIREYGQG
jgi:hypothetical protein